jgi:FG-GAP-like repeat
MTSYQLSLLLLAVSLAGCIERRTYIPLDEPPPPPTPEVPTLRSPPNNGYRNSKTAGALRPTFQWNASDWAGPETVRYELQYSVDPAFAVGVTEIQTTGMNHQPSADLPASLSAPVGARYLWRVRACVDDACSEYSAPWHVNLGRVPRDVNGDGVADLVVVAPGSRPLSDTAGTLSVFLGSSSGSIDNQQDTKLPGSGEKWFSSAFALGDFNGDGFADLAARVTKRDGCGSFASALDGAVPIAYTSLRCGRPRSAGSGFGTSPSA